MNLQDAFLNQVRIQKVPVAVNLLSGHRMDGFIRGFDSFIIVLEMEGKNNLVYKHAVTAIKPDSPVTFFRTEEKDEE